MSNTVIVVLALVMLFALLACRVPVAICLIASAIFGIVTIQGVSVGVSVLSEVPFTASARYALLLVPMFILMGVLARQAGIAEEVFRFSERYLSRVPGGVAVATLASCAAFAAVNGSSVATAAAVGNFSINEMRRQGYRTSVAAGVVAAAGTLGVLIPPSIALVVYGIVAQESIGALLIGAIVPGVLSALLYAIAIYLRARYRPGSVWVDAKVRQRVSHPGSPAAAEEAAEGTNPDQATVSTLRETLRRGYSALSRIAVLFTIVVGGVYFGVLTASESAAVGALAALVMLVAARYRDARGLWVRVLESFAETVTLTSMIFFLVIGSAFFSYFLVVARVPTELTSAVTRLSIPPTLVVVLLLLAMVPLGMFLDGVSLLLITVPLAHPIVTTLGLDPIWLGILMVKAVEISLITPPVGLNAYVIAGAAEGVSVEDAFRGALWYLPIDLATVALIISFPITVTWLPSVMG